MELRARHRNADADVDSVVAIVNPTRAAMIKRFIVDLRNLRTNLSARTLIGLQ